MKSSIEGGLCYLLKYSKTNEANIEAAKPTIKLIIADSVLIFLIDILMASLLFFTLFWEKDILPPATWD